MKAFPLNPLFRKVTYISAFLGLSTTMLLLLSCSHAEKRPAVGAAAATETGFESSAVPAAEARLVERGQDFAMYEKVDLGTDASGGTVLKTNRIALVQNGLHYLEAGEWKLSEDKVESFPNGAVARRGPVKAIFSPRLNAPALFDLESPTGDRIRGGVRAIQVTDVSTGNSVIVGTVANNVEGEIIPPHQVIYRNAFDGIQADVLLTWKNGGTFFAQDVVLRQKVALPDGFDPDSSQLEIVTEILDAPEPERRSIPKQRGRGQISNDPLIRFGSVDIVTGHSFPAENANALSLGDLNPRESAVPVAKEWETAPDGRKFLIESIAWNELAPHVENLAAAALERNHTILATRSWPKSPTATAEQAPMQLASSTYRADGYVLDAVLLTTSTLTTFASGTTYVINNTFYSGNAITFQNNCYIKFRKSTGNMLLYGPVNFPATGQGPVLTSVDDNVFGEVIQNLFDPSTGQFITSDGTPASDTVAAQGLWIYYSNYGANIRNTTIRWTKEAIRFDDNVGSGASHSIINTRLENSDFGVITGNSPVSLSGVTGCGLRSPGSGVVIDCLKNMTSLSGKTEAEVSLAVDPLNNQYLTGFSVLWSHTTPVGLAGLVSSRSDNGGLTWTANAQPPLPVTACCDPSVEFDSYGKMYLAYVNGNKNTLILLRSADRGNTDFTKIFEHQGPNEAYNDQFSPAVDQGTVDTGPGWGGVDGSIWVTFGEWRATPQKYKIRFVRAPVTSAGVQPFSAPVDISPTTHDAVFADLAVGPSGEGIIVYQDKATQKLYFSINTGVRGFSVPTEVVATQMEYSLKVPAQNRRGVEISTGIEADRSQGPYRGRIYFLYTDRSAANANTDIYVKYSSNNGSTWSAPVKVNDDATAQSQFIPWIAVDQSSGKVAVSWYDCRLDTTYNRRPRFFAAFSADGGNTYSRNVQISPAMSDLNNLWTTDPSYQFDYGDYTSLRFVNGYIYPAWADNSNNPANADGYQQKLDIVMAKLRF